ncbi:MAG: glycine-rich protein [Bacilli bacterium]|nr:glycine-rich protein [Bacilli bacterium]
MNQKGMTMVELIVSFSLAAVIALFLTEVILFLKDAYVNNGIKTEVISKQTLISERINTLFNSKRISYAESCGDSCVNVSFDDGTTSQISFDKASNSVVVGSYTTRLPDSCIIGDVTIGTVYLGNDTGNFDSIFQIYVPITNSILIDKTFDIDVIYQYDYDEEFWTYNSIDDNYHIVCSSNIAYALGSDINLLDGVSFVDSNSNPVDVDIKVVSLPEINVNKIGEYEVSYIVIYEGKTYVSKRIVCIYQSDYFAYIEGAQMFTVPLTGWYKVELWGASGGDGRVANTSTINEGSGGAGSYTSGEIYLEKNDNLYFYVGSEGEDDYDTASYTYGLGGNNGGGDGGYENRVETTPENGAGGGGATDVRLVNGNWNDSTSLASRIMVAAGGGGAGSSDEAQARGGIGGGLIGSTNSSYTIAATQISGYQLGIGKTGYISADNYGAYGGGGGGYYGGSWTSTNTATTVAQGGAGGSSFISGYAGVNAITSASSTTPTYNTIHYSDYYFIDGSMSAGVNVGDGKAKITFISLTKPAVTNNNLNNVRYIKDCASDNSVNTGTHWVELQAIVNGTNLAYGATVTGVNTGDLGYVVDGDISSSTYGSGWNTPQQCITVDLGTNYDLDEIAVWHYWTDGRIYYGNVTYTSSDNVNWNIIINTGDQAETSNGKRVSAY